MYTFADPTVGSRRKWCLGVGLPGGRFSGIIKGWVTLNQCPPSTSHKSQPICSHRELVTQLPKIQRVWSLLKEAKDWGLDEAHPLSKDLLLHQENEKKVNRCFRNHDIHTAHFISWGSEDINPSKDTQLDGGRTGLTPGHWALGPKCT